MSSDEQRQEAFIRNKEIDVVMFCVGRRPHYGQGNGGRIQIESKTAAAIGTCLSRHATRGNAWRKTRSPCLILSFLVMPRVLLSGHAILSPRQSSASWLGTPVGAGACFVIALEVIDMPGGMSHAGMSRDLPLRRVTPRSSSAMAAHVHTQAGPMPPCRNLPSKGPGV